MIQELTLTEAPIDESQLVSSRRMSSGMGAVVAFSGVVRAVEGYQPIRGIRYEAFREMAEFQFRKLFTEMESRWPLESVRVVHRLGWVPAGAASLWVEIVAPHRAEALAACAWFIDEMKRVVPIWKHPG